MKVHPVVSLLWGWVRDIGPVVGIITVLVFCLNVASDWDAARKQAAERGSLAPDHPPTLQQEDTTPKAAIFPASLFIPLDVLSHRNMVLWL
jgi:hypothetical protein